MSESASSMLVAGEQQELAQILSQQEGYDEASLPELVGVVGSCIFRFVDHAPEDNQDLVYKVRSPQLTVFFVYVYVYVFVFVFLLLLVVLICFLFLLLQDPFAESVTAIKARCQNISEEAIKACKYHNIVFFIYYYFYLFVARDPQ